MKVLNKTIGCTRSFTTSTHTKETSISDYKYIQHTVCESTKYYDGGRPIFSHFSSNVHGKKIYDSSAIV